ncbi:hypothetical protein ACOI22_05555 [Glaciecola sp. 2405UD65-10]|jgi:hypothetical protein|uniref:hypothetical protein n=1 Tax=Glaciecola sp. 2405UD65-10 TaxID=3397244 RepID=UPI003B5BCDF2
MIHSFNHAYTPPELMEFNQQLSEILSQDYSSDAALEKLIGERANLVESLLNTLDEQHRRCFAASELKTNDIITSLVEARQATVRSLLGQASKSSKAIKKYHQV